MTKMPPTSPLDYEVEIDSQHGAISVTNPLGGSLPEVVFIRLERGADTPTIERAQGSTLEGYDPQVLDDVELLELFDQSRATTELWLAEEQAAWPDAMAPPESQPRPRVPPSRRGVAGRDRRASRPRTPRGQAVAQPRSRPESPAEHRIRAPLSPRSARPRRAGSNAGPATRPRSRSRSRRPSPTPSSPPIWATPSFPSRRASRIEVAQDLPALGLGAGETLELDHLQFASVDHPGVDAGAGWSLDLDTNAAGQALGLDRLVLQPGGEWSFVRRRRGRQRLTARM